MKKIKAEIIKWNDGKLWSVYATVRSGSIESGNHSSRQGARRAFMAMCNRLGIERERWEFVE